MYKFVSNVSDEDYREFTKKYSKLPVMQEMEWSKLKSNWGSIRPGLYKDNKLVATTQILIKRLPFNKKLYYSPRGFLIDFTDKELLEVFTKNLKEMAKKDNAYCIKIDPYVAIKEYRANPKDEKEDITFSKDCEKVIENLKSLNYKHQGYDGKIGVYSQALWTMMVPLKKDGEFLTDKELLYSFKKNVRNYMDDYQTKRGVEFSHSHDSKDVEILVKMLKETEGRQHVTLRNKEYFEKMMNEYKDRATVFYATLNLDKYIEYLNNELQKDNAKVDFLNEQLKQAKMMKEERGNKVVAASTIVLMPSNEKGIRFAEFLYAGTDTSVFPNLKITNGLMYYRLQYCLKHKCDYANLGGVDGSLKDHLSTFKIKFNPVIMQFIGEYDLVINKMWYFAFNSMMPIAKKCLKIMSKIKK